MQVGWFDGRAKDAHRRSLVAVREIVERYRITGTKFVDLESVPIEFRAVLYPRFENLIWHLENTTEKELGDAQSMRELAEDFGFVQLLCSGKFSQETQRNFRTMCFEGAVERLAHIVENPQEFRGTPVGLMRGDMLADGIKWVETTLGWFSERPVPQSKKYSAEQARTILALGKQALEALRNGDTSTSAPVRSTPPRTCSKCAKRNDADAGFCKFCGQSLSKPTCSVCHLENEPDAAYCKRCGNRLTGAIEAEGPAPSHPPSGEQQPQEGPVVVRLKDCPECGTSNRGYAYKCSKCGHLMRT